MATSLDADDRIDEGYLQSRQQADAAELEAWWSQQLSPPPAPAPAPAPAHAPKPAMGGRFAAQHQALQEQRPQRVLGAVAADIGAGLKESPQQILGGVRDALVNTAETILQYSAPSVPGVSEPAIGTGLARAVVPDVPEAESTTGGLVRSASQFLTAFLPASAVTGPLAAVSPILQGAIAGGIADLTAFDPHQPRISNLINDLAPSLKNPITAYLAASPEDTEAEGRLKNMLEGLVPGMIGDGLLKVAKAMKASDVAQRSGRLLASEAGEVRNPFAGGEPLPPPQVAERPVSDLTLDPQRFQYKVQTGEGGTSGSLAGVQTYDPNLAGIIQVWTDPADGKTYVVNGHNRVALAQRMDVDAIPVRYLQVETAEEARTVGALTNIAEGRGSPIDAAKLFRDTGITRADLEARGIPLREKIATDGLALANLQDTLFQEVVQGTLPLERAVIIGSRIADPDQQVKLVQLLADQATAGKRLGNDTVRELADFVRDAPTEQVVQDTLFGAEETTQSLALDKARLAGAIREQLSKDKALFGRVSKESAAQRLTAAGNVINIAESERISQESAQLLEIFDKLKYRSGPISEILNSAAEELRAGGNFHDIRQRTYQRLSEALPDAIRGAEVEGLSGARPGGAAGEFTTSTGDVVGADVRTRGAVSEAGVPIREQLEPPEASIFDRPPEAPPAPGGTPPGTPPPGGPPGAPPAGGTPPPPEPPGPPRGPYVPEAEAARQLLTGEGFEETTARVNIARLTAPERVKTVLETVNKLNVEEGATEEAVRGVVSHRETLQAARGKVSVEDLLSRQPGEMLPGIPLNEQITATRRLRVSSATYLEDLAARVTQGDQEAAALIYDALAVHGQIDQAVTGMSAEVGRALEAHKIGARAERGVFDPTALGDLADRLRGVLPSPVSGEGPAIPVSITPERLAQMIQSAKLAAGRDGVDTLARQSVSAAHRGVNMLMEAWINGLLSGPQTHAANFLSNTLTTFWAIPERALAARLHPGVAEGVMRGEATAMLYGLVQGFTDSLTLAARAFRSGDAAFGGAAKVEVRGAISAATLDLTGPLGRAVDLLGEAIRLPGRLLLAADELFKGLNYRMELHAQAYRQAAREGLEGDAFAQRVGQIQALPPASIKQAAEGFAFYQTFTNELGPSGQAFLHFAHSHPAIRLILPFVRTPANIFKYGVERMPGVNLLLDGVRADLRAGGPRRDLALAKMSLGGLVLGTFGTLAAQGMITGDGPHDPVLRQRLRETGWQPYSVKVGDTYYSYNRLDPIGNLMGIAANIGELAGELPQAGLDQLAMAAVVGTMESMTSKTYLTGLANVLDAIKQPDQKGLNFLRGMARSLIPAGVAQVNRTLIDPQLREVNGLVDELKARLPGYSEDLPPRRNLFGEPIRLEGGLGPDLISPVYTSTAHDDPVAQEIIANRIPVTMPERYLGGSKPPLSPFAGERASHGVELSPQEYDLYVRLAGNELKLGGKGMHDYLADLIETPAYREASDGPDGGKAFMLRKAVRAYRDAAALEVQRRSPELASLIRAREVARLQQRMPTSAQVEGLGIAR